MEVVSEPLAETSPGEAKVAPEFLAAAIPVGTEAALVANETVPIEAKAAPEEAETVPGPLAAAAPIEAEAAPSLWLRQPL